MKRIKTILLFFVFSLSFSPNSNAQILKKLKKRVQKAVEESVIDKASEKASQETDKAMDSLLDINPDYKPTAQEKLQKMYSGNNVNIPIETIYKFNTSITYRMETVADNKPVSIDYIMLFSKNNDYMATRMQNINSEELKGQKGTLQMTTILDDKNQAMIMLMEEQKIAQVLSMEKIKDVAVNEVEEESDIKTRKPDIKKTGRSKKILGYNCDEFETISDDGKVNFWITNELSVYHKNMFSKLNKSLGGDQFNNFPDAAKGLMMEMHFEGNGGEKTNMKVVSINKKSSEISTAGYQFMNLSRFMRN